MELVRLAVIGAGGIGRKHAELASANDDCQLVALCDTDPERRGLAEQLGVAFYADAEAMLADARPAGAIIATPTPAHLDGVRACAAHGAHVLVEKPIAATAADARAILAATESGGIRALVGHHRRFNPLVERARDIVRGGTLGRLVGASLMWSVQKPTRYFDTEWRTLPGGGPVLINLSHDIDCLRYICGEIRSVYARTSTHVRGHAVEDTVGISIALEGGAVVSVLASDAAPSPWAYELTTGENPDYPQTDQPCYFFIGTESSLAFPSMAVWRHAKGSEHGWLRPLSSERIHVTRVDPLRAQLEHFCRVVRGEEVPRIGPSDGARSLAATLAILESSTEGVPIVPDTSGL